MQRWQYTQGLHSLGNGCYAYLTPDGSWGLSNAGLIVDSGESLLVDTLFDLPLTAEMLRIMRATEKAAQNIRTVVNTHANGDHCWGNELVKEAEIISSTATAQELEDIPPATLHTMVTQMDGEMGDYVKRIFGRFRFDNITLRSCPAMDRLPIKTACECFVIT